LNTSPNLRVLWAPTHFSSIRFTTSGTQYAPFSAITYRRSGWRSNTPDRISTHIGLAAHHHASAA
jgi:hypothetical protein